MRRRLATVALLGLATLVGATVAHAELSQNGNLRISFNGGFSPHALPRDRPAPVTLHVEGAISTTDGTQPPPCAGSKSPSTATASSPPGPARLHQPAAAVDHDRNGAGSAAGPALVGRGSFGAESQFPGTAPVPADGPMLAFYGLQRRQAGAAPPPLHHRPRSRRPSSCRW